MSWSKIIKNGILIERFVWHIRILKHLIILTRRHKLVILSLHHFLLNLPLNHHFHFLLKLCHHGIFLHLVEASLNLLHLRDHLLSKHAFSRQDRIYSHHVWIVKGRPSRCTHKLFHIAMSSVTNISNLTCSYWALLVEIAWIGKASLGWHSW